MNNTELKSFVDRGKEIDRLRAENTELKAHVISGFYEYDAPIYSSGYPTCELQEIITAEECNNLVKKIESLKAENAELKHKQKNIGAWSAATEEQWDRLRKLCDTPHEHYDGMNECSICDKSLVVDAADKIAELRTKLDKAIRLLDKARKYMRHGSCLQLSGADCSCGYDRCMRELAAILKGD